MTQEEILDYNKRCAEFLDKKYQNNHITGNYTHFSNQNPSGEVWEECKFHSDWNWIMEVVEAIKIRIANPTRLTVACFNGDINKALMSAKKEAVVEAINQFLIWYNEN